MRKIGQGDISLFFKAKNRGSHQAAWVGCSPRAWIPASVLPQAPCLASIFINRQTPRKKQKYGDGFSPNYVPGLARPSLSTARRGVPDVSSTLSLRNACWVPQAETRGQKAGLSSAHRRWGTREGKGRGGLRELKIETVSRIGSYGLSGFF